MECFHILVVVTRSSKVLVSFYQVWRPIIQYWFYLRYSSVRQNRDLNSVFLFSSLLPLYLLLVTLRVDRGVFFSKKMWMSFWWHSDVRVTWLTLLHIREVSGSDLDLDVSCLVRSTHFFLRYRQAYAGMVRVLQYQPLLLSYTLIQFFFTNPL